MRYKFFDLLTLKNIHYNLVMTVKSPRIPAETVSSNRLQEKEEPPEEEDEERQEEDDHVRHILLLLFLLLWTATSGTLVERLGLTAGP
jgi:hypothetical protein